MGIEKNVHTGSWGHKCEYFMSPPHSIVISAGGEGLFTRRSRRCCVRSASTRPLQIAWSEGNPPWRREPLYPTSARHPAADIRKKCDAIFQVMPFIMDLLNVCWSMRFGPVRERRQAQPRRWGLAKPFNLQVASRGIALEEKRIFSFESAYSSKR